MKGIAGRGCLGVLMTLLAMPPAATAQVTTAVITGSVKDAQDAVIPGATVTLISESRGTTVGEVITTERGDYVFPNVPRRHLHRTSRTFWIQYVCADQACPPALADRAS